MHAHHAVYLPQLFFHTLGDCAKLLPFLFLTYLFIEYIEHRAGERTERIIKKAGRLGPVAGGVLGAVPQCGFSAAASNLYAGGLITRGTLIAVFLSTSDEMLPILISQRAEFSLIIKILAVKAAAGILAGLIVDVFSKERDADISDICRDCHCDHGLLRSALHHTLEIAAFLLVVMFVINAVTEFVGEDGLAAFITNRPLVGEVIAGVIGLIPNCASSIVITQVYLEGGMSTGAMLSGLLVGSGVGLMVLFKMNRSIKDSFKVLALLFVSGVALGTILGMLPIF